MTLGCPPFQGYFISQQMGSQSPFFFQDPRGSEIGVPYFSSGIKHFKPTLLLGGVTLRSLRQGPDKVFPPKGQGSLLLPEMQQPRWSTDGEEAFFPLSRAIPRLHRPSISMERAGTAARETPMASASFLKGRGPRTRNWRAFS